MCNIGVKKELKSTFEMIYTVAITFVALNSEARKWRMFDLFCLELKFILKMNCKKYSLIISKFLNGRRPLKRLHEFEMFEEIWWNRWTTTPTN